MVDPRIHIIKPADGMIIRFPYAEYYEENRQERIRVENLKFKAGWLPTGGMNWWLPKRLAG